MLLSLLAVVAVSGLHQKVALNLTSDVSVMKQQQPCQYMEVVTEFADHSHKEEQKCELLTSDGFQFGRHLIIKNALISSQDVGKWIFHPEAEIVNDVIDFKGMEPKFVEAPKLPETANTLMNPKHLAEASQAGVTGTKTVLAIRVIATDSSTTASGSQISDDIFGNGRDPFNLASGYATCSTNQLLFRKYNGTTTSGVRITNGVTDISISRTVRGQPMSSVERTVLAAAATRLGTLRSQFDYVMLCLPSGVTGGIAYAYIGGYVSVYNDNWCRWPSAQMHEIGHNIRLAHSGEGTQQYADQTGMMGFSYSQDDGPVMCFNGPKLWQLGWYTPATLTSSNWNGRLISLCDYLRRGSSLIVVKINPEYYVSFNLAAGCTRGTVEARNQVVVHRYVGTGYAQSRLLAKLSAGGTFNAGGVTVRVNSINLSASPAYADVTIGSGSPPTMYPTLFSASTE